MPICLLPEKIEDFKKALVIRKINIADLLNMETDARIELLKEYAGENAKVVNKLFEEKLVLRNRELGIKNALKKITMSGKYSPTEKARLDAIKSEWRAAQKERIFSPKENEAFLNALADKMTGTEITQEEAGKLFELESEANTKLENGYDTTTEKWKSEKDRYEYSFAKFTYEQYYQSLLNPEVELSDAVVEYIDEYKNIYKDLEKDGLVNQVALTAVKGTSKAITDTITTTFNVFRKVLSTADNSFLGNQGNQAFLDNPKKWFGELVQSFVRISKELRGINTFDAILMKMYSEPNYINGRMQKAKISDTAEEIFPSVSEKNIKLGDTGKKITNLPVVSQVLTTGKRVDAAAESAFKGSSLLLRMNAFNQAIELAESEGVDVDSKEELEQIGNIINTSVGRGPLNAKNPFDAVAKVILWSARFLKAKIMVFTNPVTAKTEFSRKIARKSLIRFMIFQAAIMALSQIFNPEETKTNPLDSRFGKLPLGDKRYLDTSGGRMAILVLLAKTAKELVGQGGKVSVKTGEFMPYSNKPGGSTLLSDYLSFVRNRLSPGLGVVVDMAAGQDSNFEEVTPKNILLKNMIPISGQTVKDIIVEGPTFDKFIDLAFNFIGFNVSNYKNKSDAFGDSYKYKKPAKATEEEVNRVSKSVGKRINFTELEESTSKEVEQFKELVGDEKFAEANNLYGEKLQKQLDELVNKPGYKKLNDEGKLKAINDQDSQAMEEIFKKYKFKYKREKSVKVDKL